MEGLPFDFRTYVNRRISLSKRIGKGQLLLLGNNHSSINFKHNHYFFRQDSTILYYCGIAIPGIALLIDLENGSTTLYGNEVSIDDVIWTGYKKPLSEWAEYSGVNLVKPTSSLESDLTRDTFYLPPYRPEHEKSLTSLIGHCNKIYTIAIQCVIDQRLIKSSHEIELLDQAATYTADMHSTIMKATVPGVTEHELVGKAYEVAYRHNVNFSFPPILTKRGNILHNHNHDGRLEEGDMLLFDGGLEVKAGYAGDTTRTFPVTKKFSSIQRKVYNTVLNAQLAAIDKLKPGVKFIDVHREACIKLSEGLSELGIIKGSPENAVEAGAHALFFQHGLGHMIGLDVHDMENLGEDLVGYDNEVRRRSEFGWNALRLGKRLLKGNAITIEPGIYFIPQLIDIWKKEQRLSDIINYTEVDKFKGFGGIRIEDDYYITEDGSQLLGQPLKKTVEEIENL